MHQVSFDTHAAARKLEQAGHSGRQAEAVVEVVSEAARFHMGMVQNMERIKLQMDNHMASKADLVHMATKADLAELKAEVRTDLGEFKAEVRTDLGELKTEVRTDIREIRDGQANMREVVRDVLRSELTAIQNRWLIGAGSISLSAAGLLLALLSNEPMTAFLLKHAFPISLTLVIAGLTGLGIIFRRK